MFVSFDKGTGFSVMKKQSYHNKLAETHDCLQFQEIASTGDNIVVNIEKDIESALLDLKKSSFFSKNLSKDTSNKRRNRKTLGPSKNVQEWTSFTPSVVFS